MQVLKLFADVIQIVIGYIMLEEAMRVFRDTKELVGSAGASHQRLILNRI